jgi:putative tricarboxylic transport membrane protein
MGLILGGLVEETFSQSMIILDSQWWRFFESPIVNLFFGFTVLSLGWPVVSSLLSRTKNKDER